MTKTLQEAYAAFELAMAELLSAFKPYIPHMPLASEYDFVEWEPFHGLRFRSANNLSAWGKFNTFDVYYPPDEGAKLTVYLEQGTREAVEIPWEGLTPEVVQMSVQKALEDMRNRDLNEARLLKEAAALEAVRSTFGEAACEVLWNFHKERRDGNVPA